MLLLLLALPDLPDEDRLLVRARRGDRRAIGEIYERYFDALYQFIRWRVDDPAVAEDLTSEVFIKLLSALQGSASPADSLRGWLFRVARNSLYDYYQRPVPTTSLDEALPLAADADTEAQFIRATEVERVQQALRTLAVDQQEVLILRFGQMLNLEATADSMGKSVSAIKSLQFRAINSLRRALHIAEGEATHGESWVD